MRDDRPPEYFTGAAVLLACMEGRKARLPQGRLAARTPMRRELGPRRLVGCSNTFSDGPIAMTTGEEQGTSHSHRMKGTLFPPEPHVLVPEHALQRAE
jgi:hypothetical protein